ncbi:YggS family pyridoxal phosphate-dependent enzyme [Aliidiomarina taiwanensis]|uniref:Pyridoxal phosphate homeostasis protein n=1 Tax=Aliidiomarina taiwanensis TaxID=946228 RepID=A0A432WZU8_9GAMM|nr:YggS family pyridoxal phosphate-dependent enzyme [Aliidiomarina taiwanensis]RUO39341.1 YggS family pyridoxal phosphate-dependent enzyme [Aliidiomarina taiwanensis]
MLQATIADQLEKVRIRVQQAEKKANRPANSVQLVAVAKTKPTADIEAAYAAGQRSFGENYVQEGVDKVQALQHLSDIEWHFIGQLQSNKTREVAEHFHWVQSLHRLRIATRLNNQRPAHLPPLQVLIQLNIDEEPNKAGISLAELPEFAKAVQALPKLQLRGLMLIPKANPSAAEQAHTLQLCQTAFEELQQQIDRVDTLSLGMSNDLEAAIAHGSTMVRVGTDIFGPRS